MRGLGLGNRTTKADSSDRRVARQHAPFAAKSGRWPVSLQFEYPYAGHATSAAWALDAIAPDGIVVRNWRGIAPLASTRGSANVVWDGRDARGRALAAGYCQFHLRAPPTVTRPADAGRQPADIVADSLAAFPHEVMQQKIEVMIGAMPIPRMPVFSGLGVGTRSGLRSAAAQSMSAGAPTMIQAVASGAGLPYTI